MEKKMNATEWQEEQKISLASLSSLTGFPVDFIKKELLVEDEKLSMKDLRQSMLAYLESNSEALKN